jgi:hypothetical protein
VYAAKDDAAVHDEWVMEPHQLLPRDGNWMWAVATAPPLLDLVARHLVRALPAAIARPLRRGR